MFETLEETLALSGIFAAAGFILAVLYNIFRFVRLSFPGLKVISAVLDAVFALIAGFTLFAMSVEYGSGFFRIYYVAAAAVGFAINMLTLGFAVPPLAHIFSRICRGAARLLSAAAAKIAVPVRAICIKISEQFIKIGKKLQKIAENRKIRLQSHKERVYNSNDRKIGEEYRKGGEYGNVIKAKVRKIV